MDIESLGLSVRAYNALKRANINTVEQICEMSAWDLSKIRNMGKASAEEIRDKVLDAGYDAFGLQGRKPSHADCLRVMDDDALADFFLGIDMNAADGSLVIGGDFIKPDKESILAWLKSEERICVNEENRDSDLPY